MKAWINIRTEDCEAKADRKSMLKLLEDREKNHVLKETQASHMGITSSEPQDGMFQSKRAEMSMQRPEPISPLPNRAPRNPTSHMGLVCTPVFSGKGFSHPANREQLHWRYVFLPFPAAEVAVCLPV